MNVELVQTNYYFLEKKQKEKLKPQHTFLLYASDSLKIILLLNFIN